MRITRIDTFQVAPRWVFLRVSTDAGVDGWGEAVVEGLAVSTSAVVHELADFLVGEDPRRIEHLWQALYRGAYYRGGAHVMSAISGIDQALWDILGKHHDAAAHELFGGAVRDRIRMYAHCMDAYSAGDGVRASDLVAQGFDALKVGISAPLPPLPTPAALDAEADRIRAIRDAVGDDIDIAIDFHGRLTPDASIALIHRLEDIRPMFVEEPVLPENVDELVRVQRSTRTPIATGERLFTRWGFRDVVARQAASVLQPDLCHAGGISEVRRIAALAETSYSQVAPHNPLGPISLAACLQIAAAIPNFLIQEHPTMQDRADLGEGLLVRPFRIQGGYIDRPTGPGLGIEVDLDAVQARSHPGDWRSPQLRHTDGSVADW